MPAEHMVGHYKTSRQCAAFACSFCPSPMNDAKEQRLPAILYAFSVAAKLALRPLTATTPAPGMPEQLPQTLYLIINTFKVFLSPLPSDTLIMYVPEPALPPPSTVPSQGGTTPPESA